MKIHPSSLLQEIEQANDYLYYNMWLQGSITLDFYFQTVLYLLFLVALML